MKISGRHLGVAAAMCGLAAATVGLITNVAGLFFGPMAEEFGVLQGPVLVAALIHRLRRRAGDMGLWQEGSLGSLMKADRNGPQAPSSQAMAT